MKQINFIIRIGLGLLILFILIYNIGIKDTLSKIVSVDLFLFALILILFFINFIIKVLNYKILILPLKKKIKFFRLLYYTFVSWSLGLFIPGKIGEFSLVVLLKKENIPEGHGAVISLLDNLATFSLLATFSIIGFFMFFSFITTMKLILIIFFFWMLFVTFIITKKGRDLIKTYILRKYSIKFQGFSKLLFYYFKEQKSILALNVILTFFKWWIHAFMIYLLFYAYNQNISIFLIFLINSMLTIISLIPISISGLGVRESIAVLIYHFIFNIDNAIILSAYLIPLIISYVTATIILLFVVGKIDLSMSSLLKK